jgi:DNA (cytosine-5)-methyltransferase 1
MLSLDLFCGPGGMSEGLRMAGIRTRYAIDHSKDACTTFSLNHPEAEVICGDVLDLNPHDLPDADIIVGGPPCVNFSTSKGSRANVLDGLRLVQWFLRVVAIKRPRYWIMENVPRVADHLPDVIPYSWFGIERKGALPVPMRMHFNAAEYGVAQARNRYLIGNYPAPHKTHLLEVVDDLFTAQDKPLNRALGDIIRSFPNPKSSMRSGSIKDPNYDIALPLDHLTDHFIDTTLSVAEAEDIRRVKTEHPYMGRMSFPDELGRPARTVVATQLGRETLVLATGDGTFRRATIRECASIQSFPISYQFTGNSIGSRYRQAGDAVPPLLSYSIARLITGAVSPILRDLPKQLSLPLKEGFKRRTTRRIDNPRRKFAEMIPGKEVRGSRVELDNLNFSRSLKEETLDSCSRIWEIRLHLGEGKGKAREIEINFEDSLRSALKVIIAGQPDHALVWSEFFINLANNLPDEFSPQQMQKLWAENADDRGSPMRLVKRVSEIVEANFPRSKYFDLKLPITLTDSFADEVKLRVRLLAAIIGGGAFLEHCYRSANIKDILNLAIQSLKSNTID